MKTMKYPPKKINIDSLTQSTSSNGFRIYTDDEAQEYISTTTLLGLYEDQTGLRQWEEKLGLEKAKEERDLAALRGTKAHNIVENYLLSDRVDREIILNASESPFATNAINHFYRNVAPIRMEARIAFHDGHVGYAGQFDSLLTIPDGKFEYDGTVLPELKVITDLKTKKASKGIKQEYIFKHLIQLSAYIIAEEIQSGIKLDGAVIVFAYPRSCKTYFLSRNKVDYYWSIFYKFLEDYYKISELDNKWGYFVAQSEYMWHDELCTFLSNAPILIKQVENVNQSANS